jgi:hypothetical protein
MVANGFRQCRLEIDEAFVEGRGILAVQRDHLGPRLASADDLEGILFHSIDDSRGDRARWLTGEAKFRPRTRRTHHGRIRRSGMHRHDMYALALQFPAKRLAEFRQTTFDSGVGRIEWRRNKRNAGRDVDKLFGSLLCILRTLSA